MEHDDNLLKRNTIADCPDFAHHIIEQSRKITPQKAMASKPWYSDVLLWLEDTLNAIARPVMHKPAYAFAVIAFFTIALGVAIDTSGLDLLNGQTAQLDDTDLLFYDLMSVS